MIFWSVTALLLLCYGVVASSAATHLLSFFFYSATEIARQGLKHSIRHAALITLLAALIYQLWIQRQAGWLRRLFALLILSDLILTGFSVNSYAPKDFFNEEPFLAKSISDQLQGGRLYRAVNTPGLKVNLPADNKLYLYKWNLETLQGYSAAMYSIPVIYHEDFDDLAKQEINRISDWMLRAPWEKRLPFLKAGGVTVFISPDVITSSDTQLLSSVANNSSMTLYVYRIVNSRGLVFIPDQTESIDNPFAKMIETEYDPYRKTYVAGGGVNAKGCTNKIRELDFRSNFWRYQLHSDCDTYVYFAQPFYKGWITKLDGVEVPSFEANYAFSASPLIKGDHIVERIYQPASFHYGCLISIVSAVGLVVLSTLMSAGRKAGGL